MRKGTPVLPMSINWRGTWLILLGLGRKSGVVSRRLVALVPRPKVAARCALICSMQ
jgi:hypothetical protein